MKIININIYFVFLLYCFSYKVMWTRISKFNSNLGHYNITLISVIGYTCYEENAYKSFITLLQFRFRIFF